MESNSASLFEMLVLCLFLGTLTYILGVVFQVLMMYFNKEKSKTFPKTIIILITTRICTIAVSLLLWKFWFLSIDIMLGPILMPALVAEIVVSPIFLRLFGYKVLLKFKC